MIYVFNRYSSESRDKTWNLLEMGERWMCTTKVGCVTKQKTTYSTSSTDKQQSSHSDDEREIAACFCVPSFPSLVRLFRRGGKKSVPPYCFRGCFDFPSLLLLLSLLFRTRMLSPINKLSALTWSKFSPSSARPAIIYSLLSFQFTAWKQTKWDLGCQRSFSSFTPSRLERRAK